MSNKSGVTPDYPYQYVARHRQRKLTAINTAGEDICGQGVSCSLITPIEAFEGKISLLSNQLRSFPGSPKVSFIVNTADTGIDLLIISEQQQPFLLPYQNNISLALSNPRREEAILRQNRLDSEYIIDVFRYHNLIKYRLPADVRVGSIYMQSWHANPRLMSAFAAHVTEILGN